MSGLFAGTKWERPVTCEICSLPVDRCQCPRDAAGQVRLPKDQQVRLQCEKRAGGKLVTVVHGLDPRASDLPGLLKRLRSACAAGGTIVDGRLELQGDHREKLQALLIELGYPAKVSGGHPQGRKQ